MASVVFRKNYADLASAITDPVCIANQLYSKNLITTETKDRVHTPQVAALEKAIIILNAIEPLFRPDVSSSSQTLLTVCDVMRTYPALRELADNMAAELTGDSQAVVACVCVWGGGSSSLLGIVCVKHSREGTRFPCIQILKNSRWVDFPNKSLLYIWFSRIRTAYG